MTLKALTLHQPWATLIATGAKWIETRRWKTSYRGLLLIHAGARVTGRRGERFDVGDYEIERDQSGYLMRSERLGWPYRLPVGAHVAVAELVDCVPIDRWAVGPHVGDFPHDGPLPHQQGGLWLIDDTPINTGTPTPVEDQRPYGDFTPGRYAWLLDGVHRLTSPIPAKGMQRIWDSGLTLDDIHAVPVTPLYDQG